MKTKLLTAIFTLVGLVAFAQQPPYVRNPFDTNAAPLVTNIVRSIAATVTSTNYTGVLSPTNLPAGLSTSNYVGAFTGNGAGLTNLFGFTNAAVLYVDPNGTDATAVRGVRQKPYRRFETAVSNAIAGDTVLLLPGTHWQTNTVNLPANTVAAGFGAGSTRLMWLGTNADSSLAIAVGMSNSAVVRDLTIDCYWRTNADAVNLYQAAIGASLTTPGDPGANPAVTNGLVEDVTILAGTDGVYVNTTARNSITLRRVFIDSRWDNVYLNNASTHKLHFYDCWATNGAQLAESHVISLQQGEIFWHGGGMDYSTNGANACFGASITAGNLSLVNAAVTNRTAAPTISLWGGGVYLSGTPIAPSDISNAGGTVRYLPLAGSVSTLASGIAATNLTIYGSIGQTNSLTVAAAGTSITNSSAANQGALFGPTSAILSYGSANTLFVGTNVGIGTTGPGYKLDIVGTVNLSSWLRIAGVNNYIGSGTLLTGGVSDMGIRAPGSILIATADTIERMRITSTGNIGIRTTTPSYTLDVAGTVGFTNATIAAGANLTWNTNGNLGVSGTMSATNGYYLPTNAIASWPAAASIAGDAYFGNSNGVVYLLTSMPGSTAWAATNKLGP